MGMRWWCLILALFFLPLASAEVKIAALHPLLGDLAREIGGERVDVTDLLQPTGNLHTFEPTARDLATAAKASLVLASGKKLEPYLNSLRDSLSPAVTLLDLGSVIPDEPVPHVEGFCEEKEEENHSAEEGHHHHHGAFDPHWWQTPSNMKRAARYLAAELARQDPNGKPHYKKRLKEWNSRMDRLDAEARVALADIPAKDRILVTAHASMCHFCAEYGFLPLPLLGISAEDEGNAAVMVGVLSHLRQSGARAVFSDVNASPKIIKAIADQLNVPAPALVADGLFPEARTFEAVFRHNLKTILRGLAPSRPSAEPH